MGSEKRGTKGSQKYQKFSIIKIGPEMPFYPYNISPNHSQKNPNVTFDSTLKIDPFSKDSLRSQILPFEK